MHKWFKERLLVWVVDGVRWYSNGHVLLSQTAVDAAARTIKNGFAKMADDLKFVPPGRYEVGERTGDCGPEMVAQILPKGETVPVKNTGWTVGRYDNGAQTVVRVADTNKFALLGADYGRLVAIADSMVTSPVANGEMQLCAPIALKIGDEIHGLVMPMRLGNKAGDGFVAIEDGKLTLTL